MLTIEREDKFNVRNYAVLLSIAEKSNVMGRSFGKSESQNCYFNRTELNIISFHYAFSAVENFLEHIGFILFDTWDSENEQRHYSKKKKKLLCFDEEVECIQLLLNQNNENELSAKLLQSDYRSLKKKWEEHIQQVCEILNKSNTRNRLNHVHSERDEFKSNKQFTTDTTMTEDEFKELHKDTPYELTEAEEQCSQIIENINNGIDNIHTFIKENVINFIIHRAIETPQNKNRKNLLRTFLTTRRRQNLFQVTQPYTNNKVPSA